MTAVLDKTHFILSTFYPLANGLAAL